MQVIPEPFAQRNMPPAPILHDRPGYIRIVEILGELEPKHPAQSDCHVGITGEIIIELEHARQGSRPCQRNGQLVPFLPERDFRHYGDLVRCQQFLGQAYDEPPNSVGELLEAMLTFPDLLHHRPVTHDRPGDQLRKKCDVQAYVQYAPLRFLLAPVDIDNIGQCLEGVKRNPDGKRQTR